MISVEVVDAAARAARVVVPDYQLSLAIGREGQNARLAARLTGWRIDIRSDAAGDGPAAPAAGGPVRRRPAPAGRPARLRRPGPRPPTGTTSAPHVAGDRRAYRLDRASRDRPS